MLYPPRPNNITIPAVIAGNILQSGDTSVSVLDSGNDGAIVMRTDNTIAMMIDNAQRTMINTVTATAMLNVNTDIGLTPAIRLSYQDDRYFDMFMGTQGPIFNPSSPTPAIDGLMKTMFRRDVNIEDHDGSSGGLRLQGILVTATASELNYLDVPIGHANPYKALVLDSNKNIDSINTLTANQLGGTLLTGSQPNITSLDTINITGSLSLNGNVFNINPTYLSYLDLPGGQTGFAFANRALVVDAARNIININELRSTLLYGTLMTATQPNITSLGTLTGIINGGSSLLNGSTVITTTTTQLSLNYDNTRLTTMTTNNNGVLTINTSGNIVKITKGLDINGHDGISQGLYLGGTLVTVTAGQMNALNAIAGTASANCALIVDGSKNISGIGNLSAATLAGAVTTSIQPYITRVNEIDILLHNGSTVGLKLNGTLVSSTAVQLNYTNVSPGTAQPNKALVLNSSSGISGISSIISDTVSAVVMTASQPYINSVGVLNVTNHNGSTTGLRLGGALVTATATQINYNNIAQLGVAEPSKALILNTGKEISGISKLYADQLYGSIQSGPQPNISSVTTLDITGHNGIDAGLRLGGILVLPTALEINALKVVPGIASANKAMVTDSSNQITGLILVQSTQLAGTISTASQPNITSVNTLNIANHNGSTTGLSLAGNLLTVTAVQINALGVMPGVAAPSRALVLDSARNVININLLSASTLTGTLTTNAQPNINSVNTLNIVNHNGSSTGLSLNSTLVKATADQLNYLTVTTIGSGEASKAMILDSAREINNISKLTAVSLSGTLLTSAQPNINSVNTLNIINHDGATTGLSLSNTLVTASAIQLNRVNVAMGNAEASKALVLDALRNIGNINSLSATSLTGTLQTATQPLISSVNVLNIANHDGNSTGLRLNNTLVTATATQLNYNVVVPGTAIALKSLVTDTFNNISGINNLTAQQLTATKLSLTGIISNFNTGSLIIKSYSSTNMAGRLIDTRLITSLVFNSFTPADGVTSGYSCEIVGYLLPPSAATYTFYVTCNDRIRLWINGTLVLHSWMSVVGQRTSASIFLNANQWVSIYAQYQVDIGSNPQFSLQWSSSAFTQTNIASGQMAWDNNAPPVHLNAASQNTFLIYNSDTSTQNTTMFTVDTGGDLTIDASGNDIALGALDNFNIPSHNGAGRGLMLGGIMIEPTAFEINYLKVNQGIATESKALVVNSSKSISGINSLSATTVTCTNLNASNFSISGLTLNGPLNNYNSGELIIRQITGPSVSGRVVDVAAISALNFSTYDPKGLNLNYSLDISGFIRPTQSDLHQFYIISSGYVRLWVNGVLILNRWNSTTNIEYTSDQIALTQGQWTPFYLEFENLSTDSISIQSAVQVQWSTPLMTKQFINSSSMAWDNTMTEPPRSGIFSNSLTVFNASTNLSSAITGTVAVDVLGSMQLSSSGALVSVATNNDFNVTTHNGTTKGLRLSGTLVQSTANELNYLSGVTPGLTAANKAVVLSASGNLGGFTTLSATNLSGTLTTAAQPNITSFGTLSQPLNTQSSIVITNTNILKLSADSSACYIQGASEATTNAAADIFIGNYNATISGSSRKFMIKSTGRIGIQTSAPARALTINGASSTYCLRLVNNSTDGTETQYMDIGVDISSNMILGSTGSGTATIGVSTGGIMKIIPSGGSLQIGNTSNNNLPLEVGAANYTVSTVVGYLNSAGSAGTVIPTDVSYSLRTTASIIVNGTVCVTSDERLKNNIQPLNSERCRNFIQNSKPVSFRYTKDKRKQLHFGLIAQHVAASDFASLVSIAPCPGLKMEYNNGFISPADSSLTISYEEIIPIIMTTTKSVIDENEQLKQRVSQLEQIVNELAETITILKDKIN